MAGEEDERSGPGQPMVLDRGQGCLGDSEGRQCIISPTVGEEDSPQIWGVLSPNNESTQPFDREESPSHLFL